MKTNHHTDTTAADPILHAGPGALPAIDYAAGLRESLTHEEKLRLIRDGRPTAAEQVSICPTCGYIKSRFEDPVHDPGPALPKLSPTEAQAERQNFREAIARIFRVPAERLNA